MDELEKMGVIILNDNDKSRLALLKTIKNPQAVIVLSAHGTPQEALSYSSTHFQKVYDLTCPFLQSNFTLIKRLITQGYHVIYYGKRHHPETQAILSLSPYIVLVEDVNGIKEIK
jgi:4-hydroxy-3-methylbut-2-enyl diphosphate reductase